MIRWKTITDAIRDKVAAALRADILASTTAKGFGDRVKGHDRDPEEPDTPDSVQRGGHYPFFGRPPKGSEVAVAALGGSGNSLITIASRCPSVQPELSAEGDALIQTTHGQKIEIFSDQKLKLSSPSDTTITAGGKIAASASGNVEISAGGLNKVIVNGGSDPIAAKGDGIKAGELRSEASTDPMSMKDTIEVFFVSTDPQDPNFGLDQKLLEFTLPAGSAVFPAPGGQKKIDLTGVITRGRARFVG